MALFRDDWQDEGEIRFSRPQPQPQPQQQGGRGGFLSSLISEAGGTGGALGGAALGTALFPGVGTIVGGALGGFLGGTVGSAAEQQVRDDEVSLEKALTEGAFEGAFGAGPLRLGKLGYGATKGLIKGGGKAAVKEAGEKALGPGAIARAGQVLRGEARGVGVGERLAGGRIGPQRTKELNSFLENTVKVRGLSAPKQLESLESFISLRNNQLTEAIQKGNRALTRTDKEGLIKKLQNKYSRNIIGATPRQQGIFDDLTARVGQVKDVSGLDQLRKLVDDNINFARNVASPEPGAEQVFKLFRKELTEDVANKVGAVKGLKSQLSKAFDAQEMLLKKSSKPGSGISPAGMTLPGRAAQAGQSVLGKTFGGADALSGFTPGRTAARVGAGSVLASATQQQPQSLEDAMLGATESGLPAIDQGLQGQGLPGQDMQGVAQSPYTREALLYDMSRDPENAGNYIDYYNALQEVFAPPEADEGAVKMQNAQTIVDNLMSVYEQVGGPQGAYAGRASNVLGALNVGEGNERARAYEQNRLSYLTPIIKAFGEVGVLTDRDREVIANAIPSITDTPAQAEQKRALLYQMISTLGSSGGQDNLLNAIMGAQQTQGIGF